MQSWKDLPNAANINRVLVSLKNNPGKWAAAQYDACRFVDFKQQADAYLCVRTICNDRQLTSEMEEALNTAWNNSRLFQNAYIAAANAIVTLIAHEDSDVIMDEHTVSQVQKAAVEHNECAMLLLPSTLAFQ